MKDGKTAELPGNIDIEVVFPVTVSSDNPTNQLCARRFRLVRLADSFRMGESLAEQVTAARTEAETLSEQLDSHRRSVRDSYPHPRGTSRA